MALGKGGTETSANIYRRVTEEVQQSLGNNANINSIVAYKQQATRKHKFNKK